MIVYDLDGKKSSWKLTGYTSTNNKYINRPRSKLHLAARKLLSTEFPTLQLLEEVSVKIQPRLTLYLDFYIPLLHTAIEVHGAQHYSYTSFYHKRKWDFVIQKKNDAFKLEWCNLNHIDLITLPYDEDINEWRQRLSNEEDE